MATYSSVLAWRIPWTEKPGRLQSMGSRRVGHDWSDLAAAAVYASGGNGVMVEVEICIIVAFDLAGSRLYWKDLIEESLMKDYL